jgi:hypothetical protein
LFPIQTRVSDRSHLVRFDVTILFEDAGSRLENNMDTPRESNRGLPHAKETSPNTPDPGHSPNTPDTGHSSNTPNPGHTEGVEPGTSACEGNQSEHP